jgi:hypothetical protein
MSATPFRHDRAGCIPYQGWSGQNQDLVAEVLNDLQVGLGSEKINLRKNSTPSVVHNRRQIKFCLFLPQAQDRAFLSKLIRPAIRIVRNVDVDFGMQATTNISLLKTTNLFLNFNKAKIFKTVGLVKMGGKTPMTTFSRDTNQPA